MAEEDRSTHFIAIRISNDEVMEAVLTVQRLNNFGQRVR